MWGVGLAVLLAYEVVSPHPVVLLVLVLGGLEAYRRWRQRFSPSSQAYHHSRAQRMAVAAGYVALLAVLATGTALTYVPRALGS